MAKKRAREYHRKICSTLKACVFLIFSSPLCGNVKYCPLDKFFERVRSEQITEFESEKRCRDVNVHKMINAKIQNLKRCRLIDCQKGSYGN